MKIIKSIFWTGLLVAWVAFFGPHICRSYVKLGKLKNEEKQLKERITALKEEISDYNSKIGLMGDDFQKEKIARDKLLMIKEQEEIYRFINKK